MKNLILAFVVITASSVYSMHNPQPDGSNTIDTLFGKVDADVFSKASDDLDNEPDEEGFLFGPHIHDVASVQPNHAPQFHMPSDAEIKQTNRQISQRLMERAQKMRAEGTSMNTFIDFDWQQGATILTLAAGHKCRQHIIEFAIDHGANPDLANKSGITPLKQAIESLCLSNVRYLIQKGATFCHDKTLLAKICSPFCDVNRTKATRKRVELLHLFLQYGADPNTTHLDPTIPHTPCLLSYLLCHFQYGIPLAKKYPQNYPIFLDQRKQMIMVLLQAGLNPLKKDEQGKTDWQKIVELKDEYDPKLFDFAEEQIQKGK